MLLLHLGITGGDAAIDRDVHNLATLQIFGENNGSGLVRMALNDAFFLKRAQVAHGRRLAGKPEMPLNVARARHDALLTLVLAQVFQKFTLTVGEFDWGSSHVNSVRSNMRLCKRFSETTWLGLPPDHRTWRKPVFGRQSEP
jgi:hypothetical protein